MRTLIAAKERYLNTVVVHSLAKLPRILIRLVPPPRRREQRSNFSMIATCARKGGPKHDSSQVSGCGPFFPLAFRSASTVAVRSGSALLMLNHDDHHHAGTVSPQVPTPPDLLRIHYSSHSLILFVNQCTPRGS